MTPEEREELEQLRAENEKLRKNNKAGAWFKTAQALQKELSIVQRRLASSRRAHRRRAEEGSENWRRKARQFQDQVAAMDAVNKRLSVSCEAMNAEIGRLRYIIEDRGGEGAQVIELSRKLGILKGDKEQAEARAAAYESALKTIDRECRKLAQPWEVSGLVLTVLADPIAWAAKLKEELSLKELRKEMTTEEHKHYDPEHLPCEKCAAYENALREITSLDERFKPWARTTHSNIASAVLADPLAWAAKQPPPEYYQQPPAAPGEPPTPVCPPTECEAANVWLCESKNFARKIGEIDDRLASLEHRLRDGTNWEILEARLQALEAMTVRIDAILPVKQPAWYEDIVKRMEALENDSTLYNQQANVWHRLNNLEGESDSIENRMEALEADLKQLRRMHDTHFHPDVSEQIAESNALNEGTDATIAEIHDRLAKLEAERKEEDTHAEA